MCIYIYIYITIYIVYITNINYDCAIKLCLMRQTSRSLTSNGCPSEIIDALGQCKAAGLCRP